jgi:DtxR family Mn-dependent transcriptional regulator
MEHYLEAILVVSGDRGYARCSELAEHLGVSRSSVTEMLQKLGSRGLVIYAPCEPVVLTLGGRGAATVIRERHRVLQALLRHVGVPEPAVRQEACVLEHSLRDETIERIRDFVDRNSENLAEPNPLRQGLIRA